MRVKMPRIPTEIIMAQAMKVTGAIRIFVEFSVFTPYGLDHSMNTFKHISKRACTARLASIEEAWQLIDDIRILARERSIPDVLAGTLSNTTARIKRRLAEADSGNGIQLEGGPPGPHPGKPNSTPKRVGQKGPGKNYSNLRRSVEEAIDRRKKWTKKKLEGGQG